MRVSNVTVWQMTNGGVFQLGWWTSHSQTNISVQDITILRAGWSDDKSTWSNTHATNSMFYSMHFSDDFVHPQTFPVSMYRGPDSVTSSEHACIAEKETKRPNNHFFR
jgi:hypothetical protein